MRLTRTAVVCLLLAAAVLLSGSDAVRAEEPPPAAAAAPAAPKSEPGAPKAKKAPKKKKKGKKRAAKKGRSRAPRKRPGGTSGRDASPGADERAAPGAEARSYTIRKGDSLWTIAKKTGVDPDTIAALNDVEPSSLTPGRRLLLEAPPAPAAGDAAPAAPPEGPVSAASVGEDGRPEPTIRERLVAAAEQLLDIPYRFGGSTLLGIDCSGYVQKVFGFLGLSLPRTAREMFGLGTEVRREELSIGDLVFFRTYASFPSHVGIYIGNNMFIHASSRDRKVKVDNLDAPYYLRKFIGAKRLPLEGEPSGN